MLFVYRNNDIKEINRRCPSKIIIFERIKELCMAMYQRSGGGYAHAIRLPKKEQKGKQEKTALKDSLYYTG